MSSNNRLNKLTPARRRDALEWVRSWSRRRVLSVCAGLTVLIAISDRYFLPHTFIGILYTIPLALIAVHMGRYLVVAGAVIVAFLREQFRPDAWQDSGASFTLGLIAFTALSLFIVEVTGGRKQQNENLRRLQRESDLREKAEQGARAMIESSPAAMITVAPDGKIELTNEAATRLLSLAPGEAKGHPIGDYFPILGELIQSKKLFRLSGTMLEGNGRRSTGESFFAQMWLSSFQTSAGTQIAAVVADTSDHLRDREELGLRQLLISSRIIAAAVSHEIRNMAAAASALHNNLGKSFGIRRIDDFKALGELIEGMRKLSTAEVPSSAEQVLASVDINGLLRELNIIIQSEADDAGIQLVWEIDPDLPQIRADRSGLLQVLLNLSHNSVRALADREGGRILVSAYSLGGSVLVRFSDNGPGISRPEVLFQPFQTGASATGLGLCISRAIIRTFGGELRYVARSSEGYFLIELPAAADKPAAQVGNYA